MRRLDERWTLLSALRLHWSATPVHVAALAIVVVVQAGLGVASTVATGMLIGAIRGGVTRIGVLLVAVGCAVVVQNVFAALQGTLTASIRLRMQARVREVRWAATTGPRGIAHLESDEFMDELSRSQGAMNGLPETIMDPLARMWLSRLGGLGAAVILVRFRWWIPVLLGTALVVSQRWGKRFFDNVWNVIARHAPELRRAGYYRGLAQAPDAAKEIRVFGLAPWLVGRHREQWLRSIVGAWRARRRLAVLLLIPSAVNGASQFAVYASMAVAVASHRISLGAFAVLVQQVPRFGWLGYLGEDSTAVRTGSEATRHLMGLASRTSAARLSGTRTDTAEMPRTQIRFHGVTFCYPGSERPVLNGLDLTLHAGQSVAIVGTNGAGKTTLVKLLCRFYDPSEGDITVDGVDLRDLEPDAWRERVGVIFQDFVRYPLPARDNVGFGALARSGDEAGLARAVASAGADGFFRGDAVLSRQFEGGIDLSGGQWQKIALARALFASQDGGVLVLDEPTANLDVRSEAELFDRFLEVTHGVTTVLISHRFSTVRRASRICVLESGRVVEDGTHDELMARAGRYAHMFNLQSQRFDA